MGMHPAEGKSGAVEALSEMGVPQSVRTQCAARSRGRVLADWRGRLPALDTEMDTEMHPPKKVDNSLFGVVVMMRQSLHAMCCTKTGLSCCLR